MFLNGTLTAPKCIYKGINHYMLEADELCSQVAIINKGSIVATGQSSEIKRRFSHISVFEVILRQADPNAAEALDKLAGVEQVSTSFDGPVQKLTIYVSPDRDIQAGVRQTIGPENVDSMVTRDTTLEEAYLSILK